MKKRELEKSVLLIIVVVGNNDVNSTKHLSGVTVNYLSKIDVVFKD